MNIVVLAPYPEDKRMNDGFVQRIKKIDELIKEHQRIYIQVSIKQFFIPKKINHSPNAFSIQLNMVTGFFVLLYYLLKADTIYSHTIYNIMWTIPFFKLIKSKIILDIHGTVPEEQKMMGNFRFAAFLNKVEKQAFNKVDTVIFVTEAMDKYYHEKYPKVNLKSIVYGIWPDNIKKQSTINNDKLAEIKKKLTILDTDTVVIYSGGLHAWQNIDLMLQVIGDKKNDQNIFYILLVNDKQALKNKLNQLNLNKRLYIDSVHPDALENYYQLAHYGFVLREDSVVNKVANPTKLIEYLYYGITPIVKFEDIGDFKKYNYNFLKINDFLQNRLEPIKNDKNKEIVNLIFKSYNQENFKQKITSN